VIIQWSFLYDLATGQVYQNGIGLHASKLGGPDQAISGARERRTDQQNVGCRKEFIESIWCSDPVHPLIRPATPVDRVHPHADARHQSACRGANAAEAEDSADPACEHAVACKLIELTTLEVFVLHDQALGGSKGHRERVFGHRLGMTAAVGCHGHTLGEFAQRNEIHASDDELDEPRAVQ
jgi:hypothetical protein